MRTAPAGLSRAAGRSRRPPLVAGGGAGRRSCRPVTDMGRGLGAALWERCGGHHPRRRASSARARPRTSGEGGRRCALGVGPARGSLARRTWAATQRRCRARRLCAAAVRGRACGWLPSRARGRFSASLGGGQRRRVRIGGGRPLPLGRSAAAVLTGGSGRAAACERAGRRGRPKHEGAAPRRRSLARTGVSLRPGDGRSRGPEARGRAELARLAPAPA